MALSKAEISMLREYLCDQSINRGLSRLTPERLAQVRAMKDDDVKKLISDYKITKKDMIDEQVTGLQSKRTKFE